MTKWDKVKQKIAERDQNKCVRCACPATDCHHRKPRKMGGTRNNNTVYGYANLISLCRTCHIWVHTHPAGSYQTGFLVRENENPETVPVTVSVDVALTLKTDGTSEYTGLCDLF